MYHVRTILNESIEVNDAARRATSSGTSGASACVDSKLDSALLMLSPTNWRRVVLSSRAYQFNRVTKYVRNFRAGGELHIHQL